MSDYFKVGDDVEVYTSVSYRNGTVVAVLPWPDNDFPVVVQFEAFNGKPGFERCPEIKVYARYSQDGLPCKNTTPTKIRRPREVVVSNVYRDTVKHHGPAMPWCSEEAARLTRGKECIGYLRGEKRGDTIVNVEYVSLEK
jgi:hypothetical protein